MRVLLVHQDENTLIRLTDQLSKFKPEFAIALDGADGLHLARQQHFDLVICGIKLPLISGYELARAIRNIYISNPIPIFFLSDDFVSLGEHSLIEKLSASIVNVDQVEALIF